MWERGITSSAHCPAFCACGCPWANNLTTLVEAEIRENSLNFIRGWWDGSRLVANRKLY
jgi:hypothetical protein